MIGIEDVQLVNMGRTTVIPMGEPEMLPKSRYAKRCWNFAECNHDADVRVRFHLDTPVSNPDTKAPRRSMRCMLLCETCRERWRFQVEAHAQLREDKARKTDARTAFDRVFRRPHE